MMTRFRVRNYKCFAEADIPLTPVHVLIGENDSGKTSLLEAMWALFRSATHDLAMAFTGNWKGAELRNEHAEAANVALSGEFAHRLPERPARSVGYSIEVLFPTPGRECRLHREIVELPGGAEVDVSTRAHSRTSVFRCALGETFPAEATAAIAEVAPHLMRADYYGLDARTMALPAAISEQRRFRMDPDGFGLSTLLDDILGNSPESFIRLRESFCENFPEFRSVRLEPERAYERSYSETQVTGVSGRAGKGIWLDTKHGQSIRALNASDGAILFLGFLALAHLPQRPKLLLIDEPENGIYPKRLREVVHLLRQIVEKGNGTPQIIFTTHSPYVLSHFEPEEVTVTSRGPDGAARARPLREARNLKELMPSFYLGELWYNLTEEELFGGETSKTHDRPRRRRAHRHRSAPRR